MKLSFRYLEDMLGISRQTFYHNARRGNIPVSGDDRYEVDEKDILAIRKKFGLPADPLNKVVSVMMQKGGVGKTVIANALGVRAAIDGRKTLIIDLDSQSDQLKCMGMDDVDVEKSTYHVLIDGLDPRKAILKTSYNNLDIMPADEIDMPALDLALSNKLVKREEILRNVCKSLQETYDIIVLDCPPNFGITHQLSIIASDIVLIPIQATLHNLKAFDKFLARYNEIKNSYNLEQKAWVFPNFFNKSFAHDARVISVLTENYNDEFIRDEEDHIVIKQTQEFKKAMDEDRTIWDTSRWTGVKNDINRLYNAVIYGDKV